MPERFLPDEGNEMQRSIWFSGLVILTATTVVASVFLMMWQGVAGITIPFVTTSNLLTVGWSLAGLWSLYLLARVATSR